MGPPPQHRLIVLKLSSRFQIDSTLNTSKHSPQKGNEHSKKRLSLNVPLLFGASPTSSQSVMDLDD